ncbi:MAG: hypothetical protein O2867_00005, partial [Bacteroidetes bacterium]|nr:hypothetical protein [Bacteroidota bacterium]
WTIITRIFIDFRLTVGEVLLAYRFELLVSVFVTHLLVYTVFLNKELKFKYNWLYIVTILFVIMIFGQDYRENFIYFQF